MRENGRKETQTTRVTLTIPIYVRDAMQKFARRNDQSMSKYMSNVIKKNADHILERGVEPSPREEIYYKTSDLVYSSDQVYIVERSPVIIMGPRENSQGALRHEQRLYATELAFLQECKAIQEKEFHMVAVEDKISRELERAIHDDHMGRIETYQENLRSLKDLVRNSAGVIQFVPAKREPPFIQVAGLSDKGKTALEWIPHPEMISLGTSTQPTFVDAIIESIEELMDTERFEDTYAFLDYLEDLPSKLSDDTT